MVAFWILRPRPLGSAGTGWPPAEALPPPRLLLVCFAPAGTSASLFLEWQVSLPDGVQLLAVELPGRGARMREAPLDSMPELMRVLLPKLLPELGATPYVLFGHSMGAWIAYQLTRDLACSGGPLPLKLYASANRSPLLAGVQHDVDPVVMHSLPAEQFWTAMERRYGPNPSLAHSALRRRLQPMLQADFKLIETWRPDELAAEEREGHSIGSGDGQAPLQPLPLPCAVVAIGAAGDCRYTAQQLGDWVRLAPPGGYQERWFEGEHNYICSDTAGRRQLLRWLAEDLQELLNQLPGNTADAADSTGAAPKPHDGGAVDGSGSSIAREEVLQVPASEQPPASTSLPNDTGAAFGDTTLQPPPAVAAERHPGDGSKGMQPATQVQRAAQEQAEQHAPSVSAPITPASICWCW